jgi:3-oxoacyl-[acyl-carrier protein] reductase
MRHCGGGGASQQAVGAAVAVSSKPATAGGRYNEAMEMGLAGASIIVTGASAGIGRAIAVAFAREGARVAITFRDRREEADATAELVRAAGGEPLVARFALEEPATAAAVVAAVRDRWGGVNALVNNAVAWPVGFQVVEELSFEAWCACVHANLDGTFAMICAALPALRASAWGRIVTISTGLVADGYPGAAAYASGKAGLHGLHRTLAKELGPAGILANIVMSGAVATRDRPAWLVDSMKRSAVTGRLTEADEVARTVVFLASRANGHVTGEALRCDGFFASPPRREAPPA